MTIATFTGEYRYLSNFYRCPVVFENMTFPSVEHAYQAAKSLDPLIRRGIAALYSPSSAKHVGNNIPLREDWESVKLDVMRQCLAAKFHNKSGLSTYLKSTYPHGLVEGNNWHDNFWGVCRCPNCQDGYYGERPSGLNWLGILLMERRDQLIAGIE